MKEVNVYVGVTDSHLVLKYPVGEGGAGCYRYYPVKEESKVTAHYLWLELKGNTVSIKPMIGEKHIRPVSEERLAKLVSEFNSL